MPRPNRGTRLGDKLNRSGFFDIVWSEGRRSYARSTGTADRREAEEVLASFILTRDRLERHAEKAQAGTTVAALVKAYEDGHIKPNAVDEERALNAGKPIVAFFGDMSPDEVDDTVIARYRKHRKGCSDATIRRELQHLNAALNHAVRFKRLSLADKPHIPLPAKVEARSRTLSHEEITKLLTTNVLERKPLRLDQTTGRLSRVHRFVQLMLRAPARPAAIESLRWFQVDLKRGLIDYRQPGRVRTRKRRTPVPISSDLRPILERAFEEKTSEFVLDHDGSIRKTFDTLVRDCGFPDVTPYVLRHTYGSVAISRGIPPALVAEVMGDTLETVMRNYKHLMPGHLRQAVEDVWSTPAGKVG